MKKAKKAKKRKNEIISEPPKITTVSKGLMKRRGKNSCCW